MSNESLPLVSVIIPAYNAEKFVYRAIDSIINQTYKNLEIWLLDDASTDNTRRILLEYDDKRIKTFFLDTNTKKIGIVNEVLSKINGDLIAFQDADDWSNEKRIEKQVELLLNDANIGIVFTGIDVTHEDHKRPILLDSPTSNDEIKEYFFNYGNNKSGKNIACATMIVRKSIINAVGGYHPYFMGKAGSDIYWTYSIVKKTNAICINEPLYHVQRTQGSFTSELHKLHNIKSAYIWKVISKVIEYDKIGIDLLSSQNRLLLKEVELECCEERFKEVIKDKEEQIKAIRQSRSYRIGNSIVRPLTLIKKLK
jgi:glycosyltransferase involved in cell wall biosynthesis